MRAPLALAGLALLAAALPIPAQARAAVDECQGKPATIVVAPGTESADGTSGDDVILVLGRGTSVFGRTGDDTICFPEGDGAAFGGGGHDSLQARGTDAPDDLYVNQFEDLDIDLGPADDILRLRSSTDGTGSVVLGDGKDEIHIFQLRAIAADLQRGRLVVDGSGRYDLQGVESVYAEARHTILVGAAAQETLTANGTACTIAMHGGGGGDRLTVAEDGGKNLHCQGYARVLDGQKGDDVLTGGAQGDRLIGGPGRDAAYGGGGRDRCVAETERNCES